MSSGEWAHAAAEGTDVHRVADSAAGWLDRYGDWVLWSGSTSVDAEAVAAELAGRYGHEPRGILWRELVRSEAARAPARVLAGCAPGIVEVRERGVRFRVEPAGGYSTGFFPDQRGNRAWVSELGALRTLNLFAYTCSFSVCAASGGGVTTSVDVSRRALARGRENFELNGIDAAAGHRFVAEDAATYVARLGRRGESFDLIVLDPPTFGRAGARTFRLAHDLGAVVDGCLGVLARGGRMLVSCNAQGWTEARLRSVVEDASKEAPAWEPAAVPLPHGAVSCRLRRR